jgi:aspartate racemase
MKRYDFNPFFIKESTSSSQIQSYLYKYECQLKNDAYRLQYMGRKVKDQDFISCSFSFYAPKTNNSHILLLGGMGPLAGVYGMRDTLRRVKFSTSVTLFQACSVPARHTNADIISALYSALISALSVCPKNKDIELIVLCNSAHMFMEDVLNKVLDYPETLSRKINFYSLKGSIDKNYYLFEDKKSIALQTSFSLNNSIYGACQKLNTFNTPKLISYQKDLMDSINAVKSFNKQKIIKSGSKVFNVLEELDIQKVLLGCTEIPIIISYLKKYADTKTKKYLEKIDLIDPLHITLNELESKKI